ncbi:ABC transporter substrate-binding protein [Streptomyces sp. URMC 123]|uniref:ABC transporter substrate-binding protein n=1 Tax=Streptomyces sp. URMC 123 TaxID=3423403 RepID=UPI003F1CDC96
MLRRRALIAATLLATLVSCGTSPDGGGSDSAAAEGFPYTVTNCGVSTTFKAPPKRAVTMNQHVTEVMLELGLEKSLAGTAYLDDKVLPAYESAYRSVPVLSAKYPSREALLAANPDFVYGGYSSAFALAEGRDREGLKKSGVATRLNVENCSGGSTSVEDLYREIREVGRTFGVPARAEKWVEKAQGTFAATEKKLAGAPAVPVFVYDSGDKTAYTVGGKGIGNEIIKRAGGRNVFADIDKSFGDASWEAVVARRPEVVVIYDYGATTVEQKKKRLLEDPALAEVPAIKNRRFAVMSLSDTVLGVRVPEAVGRLADQLHPATKS